MCEKEINMCYGTVQPLMIDYLKTGEFMELNPHFVEDDALKEIELKNSLALTGTRVR